MHIQKQKNQPIETDAVMTETVALAKAFNKAILNIFHTCKEVNEQMNIVRKEIETRKNNQMEILKMKNTMSEMKLFLDEINRRLNIEKEKIIELEGITMKQRKNNVSCIPVLFTCCISCVKEILYTEE